MRHKVENIIKHGINCFVNRQLIYNFPEEIFADAGVMAIVEWLLPSVAYIVGMFTHGACQCNVRMYMLQEPWE